jgi:hypothetical protein
MPSLEDLQTGIGDLGFEVIVINRAIDAALQEMEQVAQCILLDFPVANIALLVQRIADLVTDNLGGPVKDANAMLARWLETSTQLRTSLHTSLLPIGCINIGLSRHRALLFKVSSLPPSPCLSVFVHGHEWQCACCLLRKVEYLLPSLRYTWQTFEKGCFINLQLEIRAVPSPWLGWVY